MCAGGLREARESRGVSAQDLALAPFSRHHYPLLASWFENQAQLTQWGGPAVRYPLEGSQCDAMLPQPPVRRSWMAMRGGLAAGHAQLIAINSTTGVARVGRIVVAPAHRGQGFAIPMLRLVVADAFATPGINRVELGVYTSNAGAIRTYSRLGFTLGEILKASVRIDDEDWDLQEMSLTRDAFCAIARTG